MVVDLTIIDHPDMTHANESNGLHAIQVIHNGQAMKAERTVLKVVHILESEAVWTAMSDLKGRWNLLVDFCVRTEYTPYTTHF